MFRQDLFSKRNLLFSGKINLQIAEDLIITGSADGTARSWSIDKGEALFVFAGHLGAVQGLAVNDDGRLLFTGGQVDV